MGKFILFIFAMITLSASSTPVVLIGRDQHLFWISRSKDANFIYYDLNLDNNGNLDQDQPVVPYWIKKAEDGRREDLTMIQENLAYGIIFDNILVNQAIFHFVSYPQRKLLLKKDSLGIYRVYIESQGEYHIALSNIHIQIDGGTFWVPNVTRVSIYGVSLATSSKYEEHIQP